MDIKKIDKIPLKFADNKPNYTNISKQCINDNIGLNESLLLEFFPGSTNILIKTWTSFKKSDFKLDFDNYQFERIVDQEYKVIEESEFKHLTQSGIMFTFGHLNIEDLFFSRINEYTNTNDVYKIKSSLFSKTYFKMKSNSLTQVSIPLKNQKYSFNSNGSYIIDSFRLDYNSLLRSFYFPIHLGGDFQITFIKYENDSYKDENDNLISIGAGKTLSSYIYDIYIGNNRRSEVILKPNGKVKCLGSETLYDLKELTFIKKNKNDLTQSLLTFVVNVSSVNYEDVSCVLNTSKVTEFEVINGDIYRITHDVHNCKISNFNILPFYTNVKVEKFNKSFLEDVNISTSDNHILSIPHDNKVRFKVIEKPVRISQCRNGQMIKAFKSLSNLITKDNKYVIHKGVVVDDQGFPFSTKDQIFYKMVFDD